RRRAPPRGGQALAASRGHRLASLRRVAVRLRSLSAPRKWSKPPAVHTALARAARSRLLDVLATPKAVAASAPLVNAKIAIQKRPAISLRSIARTAQGGYAADVG